MRLLAPSALVLAAVLLSAAPARGDDPPVEYQTSSEVYAALAQLADTAVAAGSFSTLVTAVKEAGLSDGVKTMIGGAPVTQAFCDEIGADGYAPDAASAADLAKSLLG